MIPAWFLLTAVIVGCIYFAAVTVGSWLGEWSAAVRRREAAALTVQAADHGEPARADVEAAMEGTPVYDELAADHPALGALAAAEAARVDEEWSRIQANGWVQR